MVPNTTKWRLKKYNQIHSASVGAGVLLGGLGGATLGTAGGFAAAGATTAAVMALGTASTGTAIASLSGVAATNATLAALGGGAIAAGGGMALGTTILGATTLGAGLLVGGIIFNFAGGAISKKADQAKKQMEQAESEIYVICQYLRDLRSTETKYEKMLNSVDRIYRKHLDRLEDLVILSGKTDWQQYSDQEKQLTENTALLVSVLFQMCKVQLVLTAEDAELNKVNHAEVNRTLSNTRGFMEKKGFPVLA